MGVSVGKLRPVTSLPGGLFFPYAASPRNGPCLPGEMESA